MIPGPTTLRCGHDHGATSLTLQCARVEIGEDGVAVALSEWICNSCGKQVLCSQVVGEPRPKLANTRWVTFRQWALPHLEVRPYQLRTNRRQNHTSTRHAIQAAERNGIRRAIGAAVELAEQQPRGTAMGLCRALPELFPEIFPEYQP